MASMEEQADKFREAKRNNQLLLVAAARGYVADVEKLLDLGAALNCKDKKGLQPLHFAAGRGRPEVVKYLWSKGAELDAETPARRDQPLRGGHLHTSQDNTPLHLAARHGHQDAIEALLKHGAKLGSVNKQGLTPVAGERRWRVVAGGEHWRCGCCNGPDRPSRVCTAEALLSGHTEATQKLLGWGADERPRGYGLLHLAAGMGQLASVRLLLELGADPNDRANPEGASPLHAAALGDAFHCAEALIEAGADPGTADAQGRLPVDLPGARSERLQALLRKPGAAGAHARAGQGAPMRGAATGAAAAMPRSAQEAFRALPLAERCSKVERWAALEAADLEAALSEYPADAALRRSLTPLPPYPHTPGARHGVTAEEVRTRVAALGSVRRLLNIQKALAAMHEDEDFQADASQPHVRAAIDALRADPSQYERYAADAQVSGQSNINFFICFEFELTDPGSAPEDAAHAQRFTALLLARSSTSLAECRQAALEAGRRAELAAAAAAAAADPGRAAEEAEAAHAAALKDAARGDVSAAAARSSSDKASAAAAAGPARQQREAAAAGGEAAGGQARPEQGGQDADLPEWMKGEFTWRKVWKEFLRQCRVAAMLLLVFALVALVVRVAFGPRPALGPRRGAAPPGHEQYGRSSGDEL
eukprot:scaffold24.g2976.t1